MTEQITITEQPNKITVRWEDRSVKPARSRTVSAENVQQLQAKHPDAYAVYREHVLGEGAKGPLANMPAGLEGALGGAGNDNEAVRMLKGELQKLRETVDTDEQKQQIDQVLRELPR